MTPRCMLSERMRRTDLFRPFHLLAFSTQPALDAVDRFLVGAGSRKQPRYRADGLPALARRERRDTAQRVAVIDALSTSSRCTAKDSSGVTSRILTGANSVQVQQLAEQRTG